MTRRTACFAAFATLALSLAPTTARAADAEEPSIHGTWVGYCTPAAGLKVKITSTLKADGSYKTVMENGDYVTVEKGKYTYSDGTLETEPANGQSATFTVKWENKNTMVVKGGGLNITYKRQ